MYYFFNKHKAIIYKCDSIEVAIKHYLQDKDILSKIIKKQVDLKRLIYRKIKHYNIYNIILLGGFIMLENIEKCTTARLYTIYSCYLEGISWARKNKQIKEIKKELKRRGVI